VIGTYPTAMFRNGVLREKAVEYQESWSFALRTSTSSMASSMARFLALCKSPNAKKRRSPYSPGANSGNTSREVRGEEK